MTNWKEYKLGDIIDVKHGYAFKGEYFSDLPTLDILLTPGNFNIGGGFKDGKRKYYNGEYPKSYLLEEGDIIVTMTDLSKEGDTLGYSAKIPKHDKIRYLHNQRIGLLKFKRNDFSKEYIYWLLRSKEYQQFIVNSATGSTVKHTSPSRICEFEFVAPPYITQTAIAEILSSLDDKIELNNKINQELENLAQTLFKQWFIDFEFPNENGKPYKSSGGEMVESELGEIPKGWEVYRFKDIVSNYIDNRGKTPPIANDGIPLVEVKHMVDIGIYPSLKTDKFLSKEVYDTFLRAHLLENDILMSTVGTIGRLNIVPDFQIFAIAQNVLGIRFKKDLISQFFMFCLMRTKGFNDEINSRLIETVQSSIKRSDLEKIPIVLPKRILVERFDNIIKDIFDRIKTSASEIDELVNLRDTLLPKLISGELEVSQTQTTA